VGGDPKIGTSSSLSNLVVRGGVVPKLRILSASCLSVVEEEGCSQSVSFAGEGESGSSPELETSPDGVVGVGGGGDPKVGTSSSSSNLVVRAVGVGPKSGSCGVGGGGPKIGTLPEEERGPREERGVQMTGGSKSASLVILRGDDGSAGGVVGGNPKLGTSS